MNAHITTRRFVAATLGLTLTAAVCAVGAASAHDGHGSQRLTSAQTRVIKDATRRFRDVNIAVAEGYVPTEACVALPGEGGMGYHFVNPSLAGDMNIDPTLPELLLYTKDARGRWQLAGVEYFKADADQDLTTDADRPTLFGKPFDGPMPGHEPGMPVHFDLHVWVYQHNPSGQLAPWNPNVTCPS